MGFISLVNMYKEATANEKAEIKRITEDDIEKTAIPHEKLNNKQIDNTEKQSSYSLYLDESIKEELNRARSERESLN